MIRGVIPAKFRDDFEYVDFEEKWEYIRIHLDEKTIDDVCFTILSNRQTNKIVLMAATLKSKELLEIISCIPLSRRLRAKSATRDMANNYD